MKKKNGISKAAAITWSILSVIFIIIISLFVLVFLASATVCYGPSEEIRNMFVNTLTETNALKFVPEIFFTDKRIEAILSENSISVLDETTDENLIKIPASMDKNNKEEKSIEIVNVSGSTYSGKLMIVKDPSRVVLSTPESYGEEQQGLRIDQLVKKENAIAGINGGRPTGIVIKNSQLISGELTKPYDIIGFDINNKLIVGTMTGQEAIDKKIRDAVTFSPVFIVNGKKAEVNGMGSGLNSRSCIGQCQDGTVLMLVLDGRRVSSLGATYQDCINILYDYGAVNAANLDGGSSSALYYEDKIIDDCASVCGSVEIPTAFVVKKQGADMQ